MAFIELVNSRDEASKWGTGSYRPGKEFARTTDEAIDKASGILANNLKGYDHADICPSVGSTQPTHVVDRRGVWSRQYRDNGLFSHSNHVACRWMPGIDDVPTYIY